jgi:hypothetical protein
MSCAPSIVRWRALCVPVFRERGCEGLCVGSSLTVADLAMNLAFAGASGLTGFLFRLGGLAVEFEVY